MKKTILALILISGILSPVFSEDAGFFGEWNCRVLLKTEIGYAFSDSSYLKDSFIRDKESFDSWFRKYLLGSWKDDDNIYISSNVKSGDVMDFVINEDGTGNVDGSDFTWQYSDLSNSYESQIDMLGDEFNYRKGGEYGKTRLLVSGTAEDVIFNLFHIEVDIRNDRLTFYEVILEASDKPKPSIQE